MYCITPINDNEKLKKKKEFVLLMFESDFNMSALS